MTLHGKRQDGSCGRVVIDEQGNRRDATIEDVLEDVRDRMYELVQSFMVLKAEVSKAKQSPQRQPADSDDWS